MFDIVLVCLFNSMAGLLCTLLHFGTSSVSGLPINMAILGSLRNFSVRQLKSLYRSSPMKWSDMKHFCKCRCSFTVFIVFGGMNWWVLVEFGSSIFPWMNAVSSNGIFGLMECDLGRWLSTTGDKRKPRCLRIAIDVWTWPLQFCDGIFRWSRGCWFRYLLSILPSNDSICLITKEFPSLLRFQKKRLLNLLKATLYIRERNCFDTRLYKNGFAAELRKYAQPETFGKYNLDHYHWYFY